MISISDLSPEALEMLEAKLVADLEAVRRVKAVLLEHRAVLAGVPGVAVAPVAVVETSPVSVDAPVPSKPPYVPPPQLDIREIMEEALLAMPPEGFRLSELSDKLRKMGGYLVDGRVVKTCLGPWLKRGQVVVLKSAIGRVGSLYQCVLPRPEVTIPAES